MQGQYCRTILQIAVAVMSMYAAAEDWIGCPPDFHAYGRACYMIFTQKRMLDPANLTCNAQQGSYLAEPRNLQEHQSIKDLIHNHVPKLTGPIWLGGRRLNYTGDYIWVKSWRKVGENFDRPGEYWGWGYDNPFNWNTRQQCLVYTVEDHGWDDCQCWDPHPFVCENERYFQLDDGEEELRKHLKERFPYHHDEVNCLDINDMVELKAKLQTMRKDRKSVLELHEAAKKFVIRTYGAACGCMCSSNFECISDICDCAHGMYYRPELPKECHYVTAVPTTEAQTTERFTTEAPTIEGFTTEATNTNSFTTESAASNVNTTEGPGKEDNKREIPEIEGSETKASKIEGSTGPVTGGYTTNASAIEDATPNKTTTTQASGTEIGGSTPNKTTTEASGTEIGGATPNKTTKWLGTEIGGSTTEASAIEDSTPTAPTIGGAGGDANESSTTTPLAKESSTSKSLTKKGSTSTSLTKKGSTSKALAKEGVGGEGIEKESSTQKVSTKEGSNPESLTKEGTTPKAVTKEGSGTGPSTSKDPNSTKTKSGPGPEAMSKNAKDIHITGNNVEAVAEARPDDDEKNVSTWLYRAFFITVGLILLAVVVYTAYYLHKPKDKPEDNVSPAPADTEVGKATDEGDMADAEVDMATEDVDMANDVIGMTTADGETAV